MTTKEIKTLNFYIGGFGGGYERVIWQNNKINYQFLYPQKITDSSKLKSLTYSKQIPYSSESIIIEF